MDFLENLNRLERIDHLIKRKSTGTPRELAVRLNISERNLYRLLDLMKKMGAEIEYSKDKNSYCYVKTQKFEVGYSDLS